MRLAVLVSVMAAVCVHATGAPLSLRLAIDFPEDTARYQEILRHFAVETRVASDLHFPDSGDMVITSLVQSPRLVIGPDFSNAPVDGFRVPNPSEVLTVFLLSLASIAVFWWHRTQRSIRRARRGRARIERRLMA